MVIGIELMGNIRRYYLSQRPVFITAVCCQRKPLLADDETKALLLEVMREVKAGLIFRMLGYVIMHDHFHWIIRPANDGDFSKIMQSVKLRFVHRYKKRNRIENAIRIWQPRFWDHLIRNSEDLKRHLDYIHYNPVKHGVTFDPARYPWSSFNTYRSKGLYDAGWGVSQAPSQIGSMDLE